MLQLLLPLKTTSLYQWENLIIHLNLRRKGWGTPHISEPRVIVVGGTTILLDVISKWTDYFAKGWPPFVAFMGSLLTLPGIISFFRNRREEKQSQAPGATQSRYLSD